MEERKLVTILFADFVESTARAGEHDPELVRAVLARTFAAMEEIITAHGGTVEKYIGDAVMAVFGVPVAHEDDALRAVRAAFSLRTLIEERGTASAVAIRIGLASGEVVAGEPGRRDFIVTGQPTSLAARLEVACAPGEILVSPLTKDLTEHEVEYAPSRSVQGKGFGSIEAHPALRLAPATTRRGRAARPTPFIGRADDLAALLEAHARVGVERRARLVTILGEPGVGKSRIVDEFIARVGADRVRRGHCAAYGAGVTLLPIHEIVSDDAGIEPVDSAATAYRKLHDAVRSALVGDPEADAVFDRIAVLAALATPDATLPEVRQEDMPHELEWAARRYLEGRAAGGTLTVVIEDVQWAAGGLLDAIERIVGRINGPVLVICTARPEMLESRPGWAAGRANAQLIRVEPLPLADTERLAEALAPALSPAERDAIAARSDGNPLFLEELARMRGDSHAAGANVPVSIQELIASRLDRAAPAVKRLLQRGSIAGKIFWTDTLVALGEEPAEIRPRTEDAARRDFVIELDERGPGGGWAYRFKHGLVRDVAYASIPKSERARLHDRFSRWLESSAGERREQHADVIAYHAEEAYRLARDVDEPDRDALAARAFPALLAAARGAWQRGDHRAARDLYERARAIAQASGAAARDALEAATYAAISRLRLEGSREAVAEVERALALAKTQPPSELLVALLSWRAMYAQYDSIDGARALHADAVAVARSLPDPRLLPNALRVSATPAAFAGDLVRQRQILEEALPLIRATGASGLVQCLAGLADNAWQRGDVDAAERYLAEMSEAARAERGVGPVVAVLARARFRRAVADVDAASLAERALSLARDLGAPLALAQAAATLGGALRESGDLVASRRTLESGVLAVAATTPNPDVTMLRCELIRTYTAFGEVAAAREELGRLSGITHTDVATRAYLEATIAAVAAAEGNDDEADARYADALALLAPTGLGAERARLQFERGGYLLTRGRARDARAALEVALSFYMGRRLARRRAAIEALLTAA